MASLFLEWLQWGSDWWKFTTPLHLGDNSVHTNESLINTYIHTYLLVDNIKYKIEIFCFNLSVFLFVCFVKFPFSFITSQWGEKQLICWAADSATYLHPILSEIVFVNWSAQQMEKKSLTKTCNLGKKLFLFFLKKIKTVFLPNQILSLSNQKMLRNDSSLKWPQRKLGLFIQINIFILRTKMGHLN